MPTITGTAQPGTAIVFREGEVVICRAVADATGAWSCEASSPGEGVHSFTAPPLFDGKGLLRCKMRGLIPVMTGDGPDIS